MKRERVGFGFGFVSQSKADESDSWVRNKSSVGGGGGGFDRERKVGFGSNGGADSESWGRRREESNGGFERERKVGLGFNSNGGGADSESWGRRREESDAGTESTGRPMLNLQPRTLPVTLPPPVVSSNETSPVAEAPVALEIVPKPRGANPFDEELEAVKLKEKEAVVAEGESFGKRSFGMGNGRSGDRTEGVWRTSRQRLRLVLRARRTFTRQRLSTYAKEGSRAFGYPRRSELHNVNLIVDERSSFSVASPIPGPLASLLRSIKKSPDRVALTGDVVPLTDEKVIGTWDDHDYGLNDAGKEFARKVTNQRLMLDFLDEPHDSPRRKQAGVYASYTFGPTGRQIKSRWSRRGGKLRRFGGAEGVKGGAGQRSEGIVRFSCSLWYCLRPSEEQIIFEEICSKIHI